MQSTYTLAAEFGKSDGKSHRIRIKDFDIKKSADEIKTSLTKLTKLQIFEKNGVGLFQELRRAKVIQRTERQLFDDKKDGKKKAQVPTAEVAPVEVPETQSKQVSIPDTQREMQETIRVPEDLTIIEEWPQPNCLIQTIELPKGYHSWDLNENQAFMLINACFPADVELVNIEADDQSEPAKLIVTGKRVGEAPKEGPKEATIAAVNKESPPTPIKKKRKRLLGRIRKRE